jgi:uncharacterized membrane protein YfcA
MVTLSDVFLLCGFAFVAGFVDGVVGGGGLIQTPAILFTLPEYPVTVGIGTTKIPSSFGSLTGAVQYGRQVKLRGALLAWLLPVAFGSALLGSWVLTRLSNAFLKPFLLVVMLAVFGYTLARKSFGTQRDLSLTPRQRLGRGIALSAACGFYDGFFGPGTGSFLVLGFVGALGFDFLRASAHAKAVNLATNLASVLLFGVNGLILYSVALPMAVCNATGAFCGARLALLRGNGFVRVFFLGVVLTTILRFAYDLFR